MIFYTYLRSTLFPYTTLFRSPFGLIQLLRNSASDRPALLTRGPHQCYGGIVFVQVSPPESFWDGLHRMEIDHIQRAAGNDLGYLSSSCRPKAIFPRTENSSHNLVCPFRRGKISHTGKISFIDKRFHGPASIPGGVKHQQLVASLLQYFSYLRDTRCGHSKHRCRNQRFFPCRRNLLTRHAADGSGCICQYSA